MPFNSVLPTKPLKHVAALRGEKVDSVPADGEYIGLEQIDSGTGRLSDIELQQQPEGTANVFNDGDVLFGKLRPYLAKGWAADRAGYCTTEALVLRPRDADARFVRYCVLAAEFVDAVNGSTYGSKMPRADWSFVGAVQVPCPTKSVQERIANFLDEQTARIDALIAEKEQLLGRLTEFVASQLERSFTGADAPGGRQKTGSIFFPELPLHWQASALKHLLSTPVTDGPHETPDFVPEGVPFVSAEAVKGGRVDFDRKRGYISAELHSLYCQKVKPQRDDVFMVKSGNTTGAVAIVETDDEFSVWSPLAVLRADPSRVLARFLYLAMQTPYFQRSVQLFWSQGTQPNIGMAVLENLQIAVPALREQAEIVEKVGALRQRVDELVEHCRGHVDRLREYRSSLISAAVTGQLDLSTFKAAE